MRAAGSQGPRVGGWASRAGFSLSQCSLPTGMQIRTWTAVTPTALAAPAPRRLCPLLLTAWALSRTPWHGCTQVRMWGGSLPLGDPLLTGALTWDPRGSTPGLVGGVSHAGAATGTCWVVVWKGTMCVPWPWVPCGRLHECPRLPGVWVQGHVGARQGLTRD